MSIALRAAVAGGLAALTMVATAAAAQLPDVTVQGERDVFAHNEARLVTLTRRVPYADLDLATPRGVDELQKRIADTAREVCHQLLLRYPAETSGGFLHTDENCVKDASGEAIAQGNKVIAAVKGTHPAAASVAAAHVP